VLTQPVSSTISLRSRVASSSDSSLRTNQQPLAYTQFIFDLRHLSSKFAHIDLEEVRFISSICQSSLSFCSQRFHRGLREASPQFLVSLGRFNPDSKVRASHHRGTDAAEKKGRETERLPSIPKILPMEIGGFFNSNLLCDCHHTPKCPRWKSGNSSIPTYVRLPFISKVSSTEIGNDLTPTDSNLNLMEIVPLGCCLWPRCVSAVGGEGLTSRRWRPHI
jgi:hypothetical protein